jgi:cytochrome c peroxidase
MRQSHNRRAVQALTVALLAALVVAPACSDDEPADPMGQGGAGGSSAGSGGKAGTGGGKSQGGSGGDAGKGGTGDTVPPPGGAGGAGGEAGEMLSFPAYFAVRYPPENPDSEAKAILGKILFWDEQVSGDGTVACGTCHRTHSGGSDPRAVNPLSRHPGADGQLGTDDDVHGSMGVVRCTPDGGEGGQGNDTPFNVSHVGIEPFGMNPQVTGRRAPSYLDAMFAVELFWDGRARTSFIDPDTNPPQIAIALGGALESQSVGPPLSPVEMACENRTWPDVHQRLADVTPLALAFDVPAPLREAITAAEGSYAKLFEMAFGTPEINTKRFAFAIATHERRLTSNQTPWDSYNAGDRSALTPAQERGFELFMGKAECGTCHVPPLFTDGAFHNLGFVDSGCEKCDQGRRVVDANAERGAVKTPTLRNVGLRESQGLFHYGFDPASMGANGHADLEKVMAAYNTPPMAEPETEVSIKPLGLTAQEIADIIDFMRNGLTDPRVQGELPPFDRPKLGSERDP